MSFRAICRAWAQVNLRNYVTGNVTKFNYGYASSEFGSNMLGSVAYAGDFTGTVLEKNDDFILVKEKPSLFKFVDPSIIREELNVGDKVSFSFYRPRRIGGSSADGVDDPYVNGCKTMIVGRWSVYLPFEWVGTEFRPKRYFDTVHARPEGTTLIQNPFLIDLILQLEGSQEGLRLNDGARTVAGMIIDSKAVSFKVVDPSEEDSALTAPEISFSVMNGKYCGKVQIQYDRAMDYYRLVLTEMGEPEFIEDIDAYSLGTILEERICDGMWVYAKTEIVKRAAKKRVATVA